MSYSSLSAGRFTAAVADRLEWPRITRRRRPVIVMPGGGDTAAARFGDFDHVGVALVAAGFRCFQPSVPWMLGNPTSAQRIDDVVAYAHAHGCAGAPILVGQSNGAACAFRWAKENDTAAVIAMIVPLDAQALYDAGTVEGIDMTAAYTDAGFTDPIPAVANPVADVDDYGCPIQLWYASDDELSTMGGAVDVFTDAGADVHDVGAKGHSALAVAAVDAAAVVEFAQAAT